MHQTSLVEQLAGDESAARRYRRLFVGRESFGAFIRYELLTSGLGQLPGALGYALRKRFYPSLFNRMGRGTVIGRGVVLRAPGSITLGDHVMIDDYAVLDAKGPTSRIELGNQILIGRNTILSCADARISFGSLISIGPFCFFASKAFIDVGSNVSIGSGTQVLAGGHAYDDPDTPIIKQARIHKGVSIADDVWIGTGVTILDGVTVGRGSILSAGAVVTKDVPEYTVVVGNPARVVQRRRADSAPPPA
jgi:acetyltransferase-like isoleucine patch superfamily enzyme